MGDAGARNILSVACAWGANSTQEVEDVLGIEGGVGVIEGERLCWRMQAVGSPLPPAWYEPGDRQTPPLWCDQRGSSLLKTKVQTPAQR